MRFFAGYLAYPTTTATCISLYSTVGEVGGGGRETVSFVHKRGRRMSARAFTGEGKRGEDEARKVAERVYIYPRDSDSGAR